MKYNFYNKGNKYHAVKTTVDGKTYDSKKEARRAQELRLLEQAGKISGLQEQVSFVICPRINNVKGSRARKYVADFVYTERGQLIIEDVKSAITRKNPVFTLKKQLVQWQYPQYIFRET